jgi:hypothetical protein
MKKGRSKNSFISSRLHKQIGVQLQCSVKIQGELKATTHMVRVFSTCNSQVLHISHVKSGNNKMLREATAYALM